MYYIIKYVCTLSQYITLHFVQSKAKKYTVGPQIVTKGIKRVFKKFAFEIKAAPPKSHYQKFEAKTSRHFGEHFRPRPQNKVLTYFINRIGVLQDHCEIYQCDAVFIIATALWGWGRYNFILGLEVDLFVSRAQYPKDNRKHNWVSAVFPSVCR